jgi:hypothetical protein
LKLNYWIYEPAQLSSYLALGFAKIAKPVVLKKLRVPGGRIDRSVALASLF